MSPLDKLKIASENLDKIEKCNTGQCVREAYLQENKPVENFGLSCKIFSVLKHIFIGT